MHIQTERSGIIVALWLMGLIVALALTGASPVHAQGGIIYVDRDASGANDGSTWADAYGSLSDALANAAAGDEVWVAEGVYTPTVGITRTATFSLAKGVALYGGFVGTETQRAQRDWAAHVTVLSGDLDGDDGTDANGVVTNTAKLQGANAYHVVTGNGVTETAILDGFTITAGKADGPGSQNDGGGMCNRYSHPTLIHMTFSGNYASDNGGGVYNDYSGSTITDVTFSKNRAGDYGGGMYNRHGGSILTNVTFSNNRADDYGGGLYNYYDASMLTNVTFSGNYAGSPQNSGVNHGLPHSMRTCKRKQSKI